MAPKLYLLKDVLKLPEKARWEPVLNWALVADKNDAPTSVEELTSRRELKDAFPWLHKVSHLFVNGDRYSFVVGAGPPTIELILLCQYISLCGKTNRNLSIRLQSLEGGVQGREAYGETLSYQGQEFEVGGALLRILRYNTEHTTVTFHLANPFSPVQIPAGADWLKCDESSRVGVALDFSQQPGQLKWSKRVILDDGTAVVYDAANKEIPVQRCF